MTLIVLIFLIGAVLLGGPVSSGLYMAAIAIYNRLCHLEKGVDMSRPGTSLLAGFLSVAGFVTTIVIVTIINSLVLSLIYPARGHVPIPDFSLTVGVCVLIEISLVVLGITWAIKTLLTRMLVPCEFATAAIVASVWLATEAITWILLGGGLYVLVMTINPELRM